MHVTGGGRIVRNVFKAYDVLLGFSHGGPDSSRCTGRVSGQLCWSGIYVRDQTDRVVSRSDPMADRKAVVLETRRLLPTMREPEIGPKGA
jgi:hypothetical protein